MDNNNNTTPPKQKKIQHAFGNSSLLTHLTKRRGVTLFIWPYVATGVLEFLNLKVFQNEK